MRTCAYCGPRKIWLANPTLSRTIVPTGAYFQTESTLAKAEIEIVTNVINGRTGTQTVEEGAEIIVRMVQIGAGG